MTALSEKAVGEAEQQSPAYGLLLVDIRIFSDDLVIRELVRGLFYNTIWTV
jgi:hypothetical protein